MSIERRPVHPITPEKEQQLEADIIAAAIKDAAVRIDQIAMEPSANPEYHLEGTGGLIADTIHRSIPIKFKVTIGEQAYAESSLGHKEVFEPNIKEFIAPRVEHFGIDRTNERLDRPTVKLWFYDSRAEIGGPEIYYTVWGSDFDIKAV